MYVSSCRVILLTLHLPSGFLLLSLCVICCSADATCEWIKKFIAVRNTPKIIMLTELLSKFSGLCLMVFIAVYGDFTLLRPDASDLEKSSVSLFFFGVHSPVTNYLPTSKMVSYKESYQLL